MKAAKQFFDYKRLSSTAAYLDALSTETGIPVSVLVQTVKGSDELIQQNSPIMSMNSQTIAPLSELDSIH